MRVRLSIQALDDIRAIAEFISDHNPERAASFADELFDACEEIGERPRAYPGRPQWGRGIRARFHGHYVIIFETDTGVVSILRVVHGARDLDTLMSGEPDAQ